jgi:acetylornithine deacetylase/succinyl-diaminopimelate desuccinylase-like protein
MTKLSITPVLADADQNLDANIARLFEFLRIPSLSADPSYRPHIIKAAHWICDELKALGCVASISETSGCPMVVAHYTPPDASAKTPHALFYGHYDVQPADPLELWSSPPFEPVRKKDKDGVERMYGRGTADDKGQLMTFVEAARSYIRVHGQLPIKATFLIEGEEESGSPSLSPFLKAHAAELNCDVAFICDSNMWDAKTPAITTRLRGLVHEEVTVKGPSLDLHSGLYGGPAMNPIRALTHMIAQIHDKNGKVTIPNFYDGVSNLPATTQKQWKSLKFSEKKFLGEVGLKAAAGEKGKTVLEQIWARPTAEVNGMWGGYLGAGTKTVIPSEAYAKFTFRLVGKQKPEKVLKNFQAFAKKHMVGDARISFSGKGGGSPAMEIAESNPYIQKSARALKDEFKRDTVLMGSGGSIPIVRCFKDVLKMDSVLVGFGLNDDAIHSPNEKYNVSSFAHGIRAWIRIIDAMAP